MKNLQVWIISFLLLLFSTSAFCADIFVDVSCTNNGDGTTASCAASAGGAGAYNNLSDPLASATAGDTIWVRRGSSDISITSTLSPTHDGTETNPCKLVGWPKYHQITGLTVDSVVSGKEKWAFVDSALTQGFQYWVSAVVEFTSGSNSGLKRKVIWFDDTNDTIYVDFDLPNNISAGDGYKITLKTDLYDDRPQSGIDAGWDDDTRPRPVLDGGGGSFNLLDFGDDFFWYCSNFQLQNIGSSYYAFRILPFVVRNCLITNVGYGNFNTGVPAVQCLLEDVYAWDLTGTAPYLGVVSAYNATRIVTLKSCHFQGNSSATTYGLVIGGHRIRLQDCTFGRIQEFLGADIRHHYYNSGFTYGENVTLASSNKTSLSIGAEQFNCEEIIAFSGYNNEPDKFHQWHRTGEIYNVDEDATINPPSGATTYIKFLPNSHCNSYYPLKMEFNRRQASGSKTYTIKVYVPSGWTSLTTSDIYIKAWYLDRSSGSHRAYVESNISSVNADSWNDLTITVNPAQEGTIYFEIGLKKYESGNYIAIDPKFDVS